MLWGPVYFVNDALRVKEVVSDLLLIFSKCTKKNRMALVGIGINAVALTVFVKAKETGTSQ